MVVRRRGHALAPRPGRNERRGDEYALPGLANVVSVGMASERSLAGPFRSSRRRSRRRAHGTGVD